MTGAETEEITSILGKSMSNISDVGPSETPSPNSVITSDAKQLENIGKKSNAPDGP